MKMFNYVVLSIFLALLFEMAGLSVSSSILNVVGINVTEGVSGFETSTFWIAIIVLLAGGIAGGIAIGFITKSSSENYVILPFISAEIVLFSAVMIGIVNVARTMGGWIFYITLLIIAPLLVGFGIAAYEHFRGTD